MTPLFFFSCSYFSPWFFYISLFNWLEENKAEKQEPKVHIWNAVAWKDLFLVVYRWLKDLCLGMLSVMSTCTADLRRNSVSCLNLPSASWTSLHNVPAVITHPPLGTVFQGCETAVLVGELFFGCPCSASCVHRGQSWLALELYTFFSWLQLTGFSFTSFPKMALPSGT